VPLVIKYADGRFQGYPRSYPPKRKEHPKVESLEDARVYPTQTAAERSIAHKGGVVLHVAVVLLEPSQDEAGT
jgi:hypothetical protein